MTRRLYQSDSYAQYFESVVTVIDRVNDRYAVALEATLFYPESGGQPCDTGTIEGVAVESVVEQGGDILHLVSKEPGLALGQSVRGRIEWARRFTNMQQHTGQHVLSQAFVRVLNAQTVSSKLGTEHSTIDVSKLNLEWGDMEMVEAAANSMVFENRSVKIYEASAGEIGDLRLKRPLGSEPSSLLRIVDVEGYDKSPCGGTHVKMTGEIGPIKIVRWEKVREATRVEFICGWLAQRDYSWKSRFMVEMAQQLTTKDTNVPTMIRCLQQENQNLRRRAEQTVRRLLEYEIIDLEAGAEDISGVQMVSVVFQDKTPKETREMAARLTHGDKRVALLASKTERAYFVFSRSPELGIDMRKIMEVACNIVGGKGGGRPEVCEGGAGNPDRVTEALQCAKQAVREALADRA